MTPTYHSSASPPFPLELKEDRQFLINLNHPLPSSPSSPSHSFFNPEQDREQTKGFFRRESQGLIFSPEAGGSCNDPVDERRAGLKLSMSCWKKEERNNSDQNQSDHEIKINGSASSSSSPSANKWMSSKMRLMKKMMTNNNSSHHIQDAEQASLEADHNNNTNITIRVCSDCNTTKTPLWRSGPRGPKSLCNACGIRQRKARRAMAAAAAAAAANSSETLQLGAAAADHVASSNKKGTSSSPRSSNNNNNNNLPFKKRCKLFKSSSPSSSSSSRGKKKPQQQQQLCSFDDFTIVLSKNINSAASQSIFPQDEKEAAILLMALSYGLVHG